MEGFSGSRKIIALGVIVFVISHIGHCQEIDETNTSGSDVVLKVLLECLRKDNVGLCLKWKTANVLDRLVRTRQPLQVTNYLTLVKKPHAEEKLNEDASGRFLTSRGLKELEGNEDKSQILDEFIWDKLMMLMNTRTIQISIPKDAFQGRAKGDKIFKKGHGMFLMAGMMGGMLMKMAMAKVALIAGKALIVAKIALVLSLIIGLKKLLGGSGDSHSEVVYTSSEHDGGGWQRRFGFEPSRNNDGASLAYNAYRPNQI